MAEEQAETLKYDTDITLGLVGHFMTAFLAAVGGLTYVAFHPENLLDSYPVLNAVMYVLIIFIILFGWLVGTNLHRVLLNRKKLRKHVR